MAAEAFYDMGILPTGVQCGIRHFAFNNRHSAFCGSAFRFEISDSKRDGCRGMCFNSGFISL